MKTPKSRLVLVLHAISRARERYDVNFTASDIDKISVMIRGGKATHIDTQSSTRTVWAVEYAGLVLPVVYNKQHNTVVTFLPSYKLHDWREEGRIPETETC